MKFIPASIATWTERSASFTSTWRNSWPSDDAPKLRMGTERPVLPRGRRSMSVHPHADRQQQVGEALLVGRLDRKDVVGGADRLVKVPLLDRLEVQLQSGVAHCAAVVGPDRWVFAQGVGARALVHHRVRPLD